MAGQCTSRNIKYARELLNQAQLIAGRPIDDPSGYTDLLCSLWS